MGSDQPGQRGGEQSHTLTIAQIPAHTHVASATGNDATVGTPGNNLLARATNFVYGDAKNLTPLTASSITTVGGSQGHENMQPYLALNFCVALQGIFPSQN